MIYTITRASILHWLDLNRRYLLTSPGYFIKLIKMTRLKRVML